MIFTSGAFNFDKQEYNVVDLPEPVGHEVRMIPFGSAIAFSSRTLLCPSIQSPHKSGIFLLLSTIRITIFSP